MKKYVLNKMKYSGETKTNTLGTNAWTGANIPNEWSEWKLQMEKNDFTWYYFLSGCQFFIFGHLVGWFLHGCAIRVIRIYVITDTPWLTSDSWLSSAKFSVLRRE